MTRLIPPAGGRPSPWPSPTDYNAAIQNPGSCFRDPDLRSAEVIGNIFGLPTPHASGNFGVVYQLRSAGEARWAVKCFTRAVIDLHRRYRAIASALSQTDLSCMVEFDYQDEGIQVNGRWFPILKMHWVEGDTLNQFVQTYLDQPQKLTLLAERWLLLARMLRERGLAHGDLQHGNVLLVSGLRENTVKLRLIDYDGMFVPQLAGSAAKETGHSHYQHPRRLREEPFDAEIDRFSHLVIYVGLLCLALRGGALWKRYDSGENLLFRDSDFAEPAQSTLFAELLAVEDADARTLVGHLIEACQQPLTQVPWLTDLVTERGVKPLTAAQRARLESQFPGVPPVRRAPPPLPVARRGPGARPAARLSELPGGASWTVLVMGGLAVVLLGLVVVFVLVTVGSRRPRDSSPVVAQEERPPKIDEAPPLPKKEKADPPLVKKDPPAAVPVDREEARPVPIPRVPTPNLDPVLVGNYGGGVSGLSAALVSRKDGEPRSRRFLPGNSIFTNDTLVSLPGFTGVVRARSGVLLTLRGHVPEYTIVDVMHYQMEAAVILHATTEFDLDLTLLRGRIYLTNVKDKGRARIRLRFESETWDITLAHKNDEVCVDLARFYNAEINYRADEPARVQCFLTLLRGEADVKVDAIHTHLLEAAPPQSVRIEWDSLQRTSTGPIRQARQNLALLKGPPPLDVLPQDVRPLVKDMEVAVKNLEALLDSNKTVEVALRETLQKSNKPESRKLAVYCMAAVDDVGAVLDALDDEDPAHHFERAAAFFALQRWVCRSPRQRKALYDEKTETGLLLEKRYTKREAEGIVQLLHPLSADHAGKVETYQALARYLQHRRRAIAEMSFWHLVWLSPGVKLPPGFNAAAPLEDRERYALEVQKMIDKKALPPMRRDN